MKRSKSKIILHNFITYRYFGSLKSLNDNREENQSPPDSPKKDLNKKMKQKDLDKFNSMDADDLNFEILSDDDTVELSNNKLNKAKEVHYSFKS